MRNSVSSRRQKDPHRCLSDFQKLSSSRGLIAPLLHLFLLSSEQHLPSFTATGLSPIISTTLHRHDYESSNLFSSFPDPLRPSPPTASISSAFDGSNRSEQPLVASQTVQSNSGHDETNSYKYESEFSRQFRDLMSFMDQSEEDSSTADIKDAPDDDDRETTTPRPSSATPVCRVVTRSDKKIPLQTTVLPASLSNKPPYLLRKLDDLYHAIAHAEARRLPYMDPSKALQQPSTESERNSVAEEEGDDEKLIEVLRTSLEDAGYQLLSRRDLDLCEALNAGYLLRLSILPDTSQLDPSIAREFYPERFDRKGNALAVTGSEDNDDILFGGRVLVYWRGYSNEVSKGRLILPKLDYLQASVVQQSAVWLRDRLNYGERWISVQLVRWCRFISKASLQLSKGVLERIPSKRVSSMIRKRLAFETRNEHRTFKTLLSNNSTGRLFKLSRYGGSKSRFVGSPNPTDALNPFIICEEEECPPTSQPSSPSLNARDRYLDQLNSNNNGMGINGLTANSEVDTLVPRNVDQEMYECINHAGLMCPYDQARRPQPGFNQSTHLPSMQLLKRVAISSLVNVFSTGGRRALLQSLFAKSELVEPTYEEVVVVWRPLPPKEGPALPEPPNLSFTLPKFVYDVADMFDIAGLPERPALKTDSGPLRSKKNQKTSRQQASRPPLEIRSFSSVPMANLPAVLPKTKLIFRPADAFVFDSISLVSFLLVIGSQRFDSPKLDLLAFVSVSLWIIRTVFRYSNKLARYDLLVKTFLTSKISHRNRSAVSNLVTEAGSQRAVRAALVHHWLCQLQDNAQGEVPVLDRAELVRRGEAEVNELLRDWYREIPIDVDATLNDLEDLRLVVTAKDGTLQVVSNPWSALRALKSSWSEVFDGSLSFRALVGRRKRGRGPLRP